ncbi:ATP-binding protein [Micromonospora sp. NBC_01813]|uniref:ATP-binding protein n=1 Tax=Micromonospora sp. NBC_01813 TaxID=2975988 RepID=UPI002DD7D6E4|nr:ATP-binding protein [Micromonospora sp. NBC_01813]WSA06751.1 ATP-binding protein [Micromonospora sp. NBC_01813]
MSRPTPPGSAHPAGQPAGNGGNGKRSDDYQHAELADVTETELVTSPRHGSVAVFQSPAAARGNRASRTAPTPSTPAPTPRTAASDHTDIDSPFLDLFSGTSPTGGHRPGRPARTAIQPPARPAIDPPSRPAAIDPPACPEAIAPAPRRGVIEPPARRDAIDPPAPPTDPGPPVPPPPDRIGPALVTPERPEPAQRRHTSAPTPRSAAESVSATEPPPQSRPVPHSHAGPPAQSVPPNRPGAHSQPTTGYPVEPTAPSRRASPAPPHRAPAPDSYDPPAPPIRTSPPPPAPITDAMVGADAVPPPATPAGHPDATPPRHRDESAATPTKRIGKRPQRRSKAEPDRPDKLIKPVPIKPPKTKFTDRDPAAELAITEIAGHLTFTPNTVTAWYWLPEVRWAFRPDAEREVLLSAISEQYAGLSGFRLHLRRTTRPFPADEWARTIDSLTSNPLPTVGGATSWSDHLVAAQRHLMSVNHAEGQTYLGITFARRSLGDSLSERVLRMFGRGVAENERRRLGRMVEQFDEVLGAFGMRGRRVTAGELEWLLYRSVALCMTPPTMLSPVRDGNWDRGDLLALTEQIERYRTPYGSTLKLVNRMTGEERHVAVLAVGRMEPLEIPERHEPWMHFHERLPWPMELSSRIDLLGSTDSFRNLEHRLRMIRSQQLDYAEHGIDAPPELERLAKRALHIGDEMTTGLPVESARAHGWHRVAVGGRTREECLERARRLIQLYSREMRISLQHPKNQDWLAREFIPGEPVANTGYIRRMPVKLLAAAVPQAASTVGDRRGDLIGRTAGTCRRPVFLDLHFPMEVRERSGLAVFVAEPGGGKSTLLGALGYLAARRGVQVTLLDPSGPLARLCSMPELRPYSRVLNLTGSEQGTLAPYSLIPTPIRTEFATGAVGDREYEIAVSNSRAERRMLVQDICMMLVPPQVARESSTATLLRHAVRQVPAEETSTLDDVVACLNGIDDDGRELANLLLDTAEMPLALLFFGSPAPNLLGADAALTVITMAGLRLPDLKIEREYWSAEEALALPMLHTAHRLAVRRCYGGSMQARKLVGLDEAHFMEGWRSGRSFLVRLARDSRKWNLAALVSSQNPKDILGLDVQNLVSTVFVGRIAEDQEIAAEALRLLRVPVDDGYEATLASLSSVDSSSASRLGFREFVMRDVDGRVQKIRVDVSYVNGLLDHLDTTPGAPPTMPAGLPAALSDLEV